MTPDRFAALVEAFGAERLRWPEHERAAAAAAASANPQNAAVLQVAARLDDWLAAYDAPSAGTGLAHRIAATAPGPPFWRRARLWWAGLGLVGVASLGAVVGAVAINVAAPGSRVDGGYAASYDSVDAESPT